VATDKMPVDKRQRHRPEVRIGEDRLVLEPLLPEQRAHGTGIIVLSASLRLLHMNPRACQLSRTMHACGEKAGYGVLPPQILQVCAAAKRQGSFEQISAGGRRPIVLSSFKIPGIDGQAPRLLVLMREPREEDWPSLKRAVELFSLTQREETVVRQLALGYTNKEIANALRIAEQTVKEHMKHLMIKTGACTRTGLLARMLVAVSETFEHGMPEAMAG
jgi:DNA-binding CsgD family transcriptional regulator